MSMYHSELFHHVENFKKKGSWWWKKTKYFNWSQNPGRGDRMAEGLVTSWRLGDQFYISYHEKLLNSNNPKFLRLLWDIVVFRLVEYLLNMI